jgi:DNA replication protein DnaC
VGRHAPRDRLRVRFGRQPYKLTSTAARAYSTDADTQALFHLDEPADATAGEDRTLTKYLKPEPLIMDDIGMKPLPRKSGEFMFEVLMRRHELRSTVMTSNRPIEDWGKLLGDVPWATAILDRFLQNAEIVTITGKSYRLKDRACTKKAKKA